MPTYLFSSSFNEFSPVPQLPISLDAAPRALKRRRPARSCSSVLTDMDSVSLPVADSPLRPSLDDDCLDFKHDN